jgi:hypothetical protein
MGGWARSPAATFWLRPEPRIIGASLELSTYIARVQYDTMLQPGSLDPTNWRGTVLTEYVTWSDAVAAGDTVYLTGATVGSPSLDPNQVEYFATVPDVRARYTRTPAPAQTNRLDLI